MLYQQEMVYPEKFKTDTFTCDSQPLETLNCTFCEFGTYLKVHLIEHFRVFHWGKKVNEDLQHILKCYHCKDCDFTTHSLLILTQHICKSCNRVFEKKRLPKIWFKCEQCPYKTRYKRVLKRHKLLKRSQPVTSEIWFNCDVCPYKTVLQKSLELHVKNKHPLVEPVGEPQNLILIKMENCVYTSKADVEPSNELWFNCEQCPYKTMLERSLELHIKHKHSDSEPRNGVSFKCVHCSYETRNFYNFQRHNLFRHSNIEPQDAKKFKCEYCPYRAKAINNLERHLLSKHSDLVPCSWLECKHCSYKTPHKDNLKLHVKAKHFEVEPQVVVWYTCTHCSYKTTVKYNLKSHIDRRHYDKNPQDVRWFTCEHCSYKSKFITDLKRHQSIHYMVVRKWQACKHCSFKTTLREELKAHDKSKHGRKGM